MQRCPVCVRIHSDRRYPKLAAAAHDPQRNFATVGYQYLADWGHAFVTGVWGKSKAPGCAGALL